MLEDDCRYLMVRYLRRYIFESSDGENKRTPRGLLKALQCKPEELELLDVAQCCYNLTTKKLCVELQPLRVGHGATASYAPHHCGRRGLAHQPTLPRGGRSATTQPNLLRQPKGLARSEGRRKQTLQRSGQERQPIDSSDQLGENSPRIPCESVDFDQTRPTQREERAHEGTTRCCR